MFITCLLYTFDILECMKVVDLARRDICPTFRNFEFQGAQGDVSETFWYHSKKCMFSMHSISEGGIVAS